MNYYGTNRSNSLSHWGIIGMHWGLRRWQYEDGSLTPEGRIRYGKGPERVKNVKTMIKQAAKKKKEEIEKKRAANKEKREAHKKEMEERKAQLKQDRGKAHNPRNMTTEELEKAIARMRLEDTYSQMMAKRNPDRTERARKEMTDIAWRAAGVLAGKAADRLADHFFNSYTDPYDIDVDEATDQTISRAAKRIKDIKAIEGWTGDEMVRNYKADIRKYEYEKKLEREKEKMDKEEERRRKQKAKT